MAEQPTASVLIVDDDSMMRELLKGILRTGPYTLVGEAGNGDQALAMAEELKPQIICLDIHMPKMDGIQCLESLRAAHPASTVVMISGDATLPMVQRALNKGASGFIVKPINATKVLDTLQRCFAK